MQMLIPALAFILSQSQGEQLPDDKIGKEASAQIEKQVQLTKNTEYQKRVDRVGAVLAKVANSTQVIVTYGDPKLHHFDYKFKVISDPKLPNEVNAVTLPGGYVYVYEGLMKFVQSDDELAGVLAHEIAHAALRHGVTMQKQSSRIEWLNVLALLGLLYGRGDGIGAAYGAQLAGQTLESGWSQDAEQAADYAGFQYMLQSGYNPSGMVTFMERLGQQNILERSIDWGIYRTHPPTPLRAQKVSQYMASAGRVIERSKVTTSLRATSTFTDDKATVKFGSKILVEFRGPDAALRGDNAATALNTFFDKVPNVYDLHIRQDGFYGLTQKLFEVKQEDVDNDGAIKLSAYQAKVAKAVQGAIYAISFSVWTGGTKG